MKFIPTDELSTEIHPINKYQNANKCWHLKIQIGGI